APPLVEQQGERSQPPGAASLQPAFVHNSRGAAFSGQGQYDLALVEFDKALRQDPNYVDAYNNRGYTYAAKKAYDLALADLNKAVELQPRFAAAYNNRGLVHMALKAYDKAIADFDA